MLPLGQRFPANGDPLVEVRQPSPVPVEMADQSMKEVKLSRPKSLNIDWNGRNGPSLNLPDLPLRGRLWSQ